MPLYVLFTYSARVLSVGTICTRTPGTQEIFDVFNISIKRTFSTMVLGAIVFVFTCLMAKQLYKQKKARENMTFPNSGATAGKGKTGKVDQEAQITKMMFIVAIIFWATKIPYMFGQYTRTYGFRKINIDVFIFLNDTMPVTTAISYINFMVNFFVYVTYMKSFRRTFFRMFCCKEAKGLNYTSSVNTTNSSLSIQATNNSEMAGSK